MIKTFLEARLCSFLQMAGYIKGEKVIFLKSHIYLNFFGETISVNILPCTSKHPENIDLAHLQLFNFPLCCDDGGVYSQACLWTLTSLLGVVSDGCKITPVNYVV